MIIELSTGKYLHTAYSITNIPEEMTTLDNEWSLTSQDGMDYIGTFIDGSSTESTDPNDYAWEELIDEDLDDIDEDGDIPVDDFQTQIDELQDQVTVNQENIRSINASIENVQTNVASNSELSSATADIANATNQHFWTDENGVHVSNEEANAEGDRNTLFNSIGMIFRKGANYLTAILAGGASGTDPKGMAIYDGQGNEDSNIIARFVGSGTEIGPNTAGQTLINSTSMVVTDDNHDVAFAVYTQNQGVEIRNIFAYGNFSYNESERTITFTEPNDYQVGSVTGIGVQTDYWTRGVRGNFEFTQIGNDVTVYQVPETVFSIINDFLPNVRIHMIYTRSTLGTSRLLCGQYPKDDATVSFAIGGGTKNTPANVFTVSSSGAVTASGDITANNHVVGIVETGTTSNNWDYRLWSDGTYEAWRSHGFTGMTLTSSSAGTYYGNGTTLGVPIFPNNDNTGVLQCLCSENGAFSHSSGVYLYQVLHASATTATSEMTFQFRAHASTSNAACGIDIYLRGTYT